MLAEGLGSMPPPGSHYGITIEHNRDVGLLAFRRQGMNMPFESSLSKYYTFLARNMPKTP
jgi:hypothetical protein